MSTKIWKEKNIEKMRAYRREWYAKNKKHAKGKIVERKKEIAAWMRNYKAQLQCSNCSENNPACLDFHHKNPDEKDMVVAGVANNGWSIKRIEKEIAKCVVLCANCHRKEHASMGIV